MTSDSTIEALQGELERLFELPELIRLSAEVLGFPPESVGGTASKGAFARALAGYCASQDAVEALVDAILLSSSDADASLRQLAKVQPNGELRPGTRVGGLRIVKKIGEGGLSIVYLAEGEGSDGETKRAALKVIRPQFARDRAAVHRFTTANRVMQSLQSPGLGQILGVGQLEDSRPWVAAAYLGGQTLGQRIERTGSLHINEARPIFAGILQGLAALHKRGLVHGDVKVENVFVARTTAADGSSEPTGVLVDGGGDRLLSRAPIGATTAGLVPVFGTAKAIAPEQARAGECDARTDLYQLGTLMYETLTGRPPFLGDSAIDVIVQHLSAEPEAPSRFARKGWVSAALDEILLRALAKDPTERFQSAEEVLDALDRAARRPSVQRPLDEGLFQEARRTLVGNPSDEAAAERVEELASQSGVISRAAEALLEAASAAHDDDTRITLSFRAARIYDVELKDALRAEAAYQQILERDPGNEVALRGVESCKRAAGDHEGLVGSLLDRIEREGTLQARKAILVEVASIYEKQMRDTGNALVATAQALTADPSDAELVRSVERLAGSDAGRWNEVLEMLTHAAQDLSGKLYSDESTRRNEAITAQQAADAALAEVRSRVDAQLAETAAHARAHQAELDTARAAAEDALREAKAAHATEEARLGDAAQQLGERTAAADQRRAEAEAARANAEAHVGAYEQLEQEAGETPSQEQVSELERIAGEAEQLVAEAEAIETQADQEQAEADASRDVLAEVQDTVDAAEQAMKVAEEDLRLAVQAAAAGSGTVEPSAEQRAALADVERRAQSTRDAVAAFDRRDDAEVHAQRARDTATLAATYVRMGRWYGERMGRPDFALQCFSQAISTDAANDAAYEGVIDLYRAAQSWPELVQIQLQRADNAKSPVRARDYRVEAAGVIASKLNDQALARTQLERVLADDPDHPIAQRSLAAILEEQEDYGALCELLEKRALSLRGEERAELLQHLGELYEDRIDDVDKAAAKYQAALEIDGRNLTALKGLERIHARRENYEGLIESLRAQVDLAPTPKQRIALLERVGALLEEEFVDHAQAASRFEDIIVIDSAHEGANVALARLYRHLSRFEDLVEVLERHAGMVDDPQRKVDLLLQAARTLAVDIGSPERAIDAYESVLHVDEQQSTALVELARLKSTAGDVAAAVSAVERLAEQEHDPVKRAQQFVRAGKLLQDAGNRDAAISRYKQALDLDAHATHATDALREIYTQRGDSHGAAEMLLHAIETADGEHKRAALLADLGALYRDELDRHVDAKVAFEEALQLDPTSAVAAAGLARLAHGEGRDEDCIEYYKLVETRLGELPVKGAQQLCTEASKSYLALEEKERAVEALRRARDLTPGELEPAESYAAMVMETGDASGAERLYERMLSDFGKELDVSDKVRLTLALGEAQLGAKRGKRALESFQKVLDLRPDDSGAYDGMTRAYEQANQWSEVVNLLQLRARRAASEDDTFDLLVKTGDVFLERLRDRDAASQTYVMALDVKPDNRNLLTKLMGVYSDAKDWPRLIEIILRIAEMVKDPVQLAKYYNTVATIAHVELGRYDEAAGYYEAALSYLGPSGGDAQFDGLVQCLTENQDWERLERAYEDRISRLRQSETEPARLAALLDAAGDIVHNRLGRMADGLRYYEEALGLEPDNADRRSLLTSIYTKEPKRFFERAVAAHRYYLTGDPYRVESLQALRKVYTSGKKPDESWCMCQALRCLKMADVDEEKFFKKYRLTRLPKLKQPISDDAWRELVIHPTQNPILTAIFTALTPAVIGASAQKLAVFGVNEQYRIDPTTDPTAMVRMLAHVAESTTTHLPPVYGVPRDPGGLSFLFTSPPALGIGEGAKAGGPQQALAFVAGRHLSYYRPGHYLRQAVPTGTGLRAWLLGAIRTISPHFPAPANMEGQVKECSDAISRHLAGPQRDALRSLTQKLLEAAPELDMRAWMAGVDLTADRIGFVLSNDLKIANAVIEASPEDSASIGRKNRLRDLLAYSVSEPYLELRKRLGIALGS